MKFFGTAGQKCDPVPARNTRISIKVSSIGDPEWGMYVTPDDPLRDTPEKARAYYQNLFVILSQSVTYVQASLADLDAAKVVLGA